MLMFDIGYSKNVYECIENMLEPVEVEDWCCPACHNHISASTQKYFWTLPEQLIIVFKRFTPYGRKISSPITYDEQLDLSKYLYKESP